MVPDGPPHTVVDVSVMDLCSTVGEPSACHSAPILPGRRPRSWMRRVSSRWCVAVLVGLAATGCTAGEPVVSTVALRGFAPPEWEAVLGGDSKQDPTTIGAQLDALSNIVDAGAARDAARAAWLGELGAGPAVAGYHLATPVAACTQVRVLGVSPWEASPGVAKAAVAWQGACQNDIDALDAVLVRVAYVYLVRDEGRWVAVQPGEAPQPAERPASGDVGAWMLEELVCSNGATARIEVARAWAELCADAAAAGIEVIAEVGYRSAVDQQRLWDEAVEAYGRTEAARRVAHSDGAACSSRHCAGEALDVSGSEALSWLGQTVACVAVSGTNDGARRDVTDGTCRPDERTVARREQYGFRAPLAMSPGHLEWGLALVDAGDECNDSPARAVPAMVAAVWRCELRSRGAANASEVAAQAVAVAECASGFSPGARVLDGRYAIEPHPVSRRTYRGQGVFGLDPDVVGRLVAGGDATDAWANTTAAVRWWMLERAAGRSGWGPFVCTSDDGVLENVLAGGAPAWAREY